MNVVDQTELCEPEDFMESLAGCRIERGERADDGLHLFLDDGRILIFEGQMIVWLGRISKETLQ